MSGISLMLSKKSKTDPNSSEDLNLLVKRHIESVVAQAEIVKRENLYDMGVKDLGA